MTSVGLSTGPIIEKQSWSPNRGASGGEIDATAPSASNLTPAVSCRPMAA